MTTRVEGEALHQEAALLRKLGLQLAELSRMGLAELRAKHLELFGEEARSKNLPFLRKRLAFRLQERVHGGLSPEARAKVEELAPSELPVGRRASRSGRGEASGKAPKGLPTQRDARLPAPGTVLVREFQGVLHEVEVLERGFRYRGREYRSLSAIAREITGTAWNGFGFFRLLVLTSHVEG